MAGPEPRVPYNPNPDVQPGADTPNDYLRVQASPNDFGAQIGQARQGLGKAIDQVGNPAFEYAMKQQGDINSAAAINGETKANEAYGQIFDTLRSKKGFEAVDAVPVAVEQAAQVRQQLRNSMPTDAAAKAFDTLIARTEGFVIRDMHSYGSTQLKSGHSAALTANRKMWVDRSANPSVAFDDDAWRENQANMVASAIHELDDNGITGDSDDAKTIRDNYIRSIKSEAWQKRIITIADDPVSGNVDTAVKVLEANKADIPADAYSALSSRLAGPYRSSQTRGIADDVNTTVDRDWRQTLSTPATSTDVISAFKAQEGGPSSNVFQIQPDTWKLFAQPGEDIANPEHNQAVATRMLQKYAKDYDGDLSRVAVAYFSGPGNVAPKDSATPYINNRADSNGKTVASYADDILRRTQGMEFGASPYYSKADYVQLNYEKYIKLAQDKAEEQFPGHPELVYQAVQRTEQYLKTIIAQEAIQDRKSMNTVYQYTTDMDKRGTPLTTAYQLDTAPPEVAEASRVMQQKFPLQYRNLVDRMAAQNIKGKATNYGTAFWDNFQSVINGKTSNVLDLSHDLDGSKLTNTGLSQLKSIMDDQGTPEGKAFSTSMLDFYKKAHNQLVMNTPGVSDQVGEAKFLEFMQATLPEVVTKKKQNMTGADLFTPDKQGYVGNTLHIYDRTLAQKVSDYDTSVKGMFLESFNQQTFDPNSLKGLDRAKGISSLDAAVKSGLLKGPQAYQLAKSNGWAQ